MTKSQKAFNATGLGQKVMMYDSVGLEYSNARINTANVSDYGADPIGDGTFRMVPSGDVVDYAERMRRLPARKF